MPRTEATPPPRTLAPWHSWHPDTLSSPTFQPPNSIRVGEFRLDFHARFHQDFRRFSPDADATGWEPTFRRARVGIQGRIVDDLDYVLDLELRDPDYPWRYAYVNYRRFAAAQVRAGRFKAPFGREQLASIFEFEFMERSLINTALVPARDTGVLVHGEIAGGVVAYEAGVFVHDGDNARVRGQRVGEAMRAVRTVLKPWAARPGPLRTFELGAAFTITRMDDGPFSAEGRMLSGYRFADRTAVTGRRARIGVDGRWTSGPVGLQGEYIRVSDDRSTSPDAVADGWYTSAAWNVTGERQDGNGPLRPLFQGGAGTIEVAARVESVRFGRLPAVAESRNRIVTLGLNWTPLRWGRLMLNVTREELGDPARTPVPGRTTFWGAACRLQVGI